MMMSFFWTLDFGTLYKKVEKSLLKLPHINLVKRMILKEVKMKNIDYLHLIWTYENSDH
jgi:hypothetical protein